MNPQPAANPGSGKGAARPKRPRVSPLAGATNGSSAAGPTPLFFNRDLSWLEFNRRVLAQAADPDTPLLERVKFLAIFASNLDEFFMKRVGLVKRQAQAGIPSPIDDGLSPRQQLVAIHALVQELEEEQVRLWTQEIVPALAKADVHLLRLDQLAAKDRAWVDEWYRANVFPALTPLAVDPTHRFPFISNLSDNIAVVASFPDDPAGERQFARVKIPPSIRRFVPLPARSPKDPARFVMLHEIIRANLAGLFPGMVLHEQVCFRVTRGAGIQRDDLETMNLLQSVESELKQRKFARTVRLEIEPEASPTILRWLLDKLRLDTQDVYERPGVGELSALMELGDLDRPGLRFTPWKPVVPPRLKVEIVGERTAANLFAAIRKQDVLLHHPYESFHDSVERFIAAAALDPDVVTIKQTLYRTSPDSPFVESLIKAAEAGKQVACLVELRARFDEDRNVRFARQLEKHGVHVAYGVVGLKTHCKTSLVVRREKQGLRCYGHLGTGNYHPRTAQLYTDLGLLTCDPGICADLVQLFNYLTGLAAGQAFQHLLVAPFNLRSRLYQLIEREMANAKAKKPARILAKMNSLEDREMTEKLYAASQAGVPITLVVRGFCCLRPGVPGLSDNIKVVSVVGRFLEHSRIFHFAAGRDDPVDGDWFLSSADWMYRNLSNRVEVACPVRDADACRRLHHVFEIMLADHRKAWDLATDGTYARRTPPADAPADSPQVLGTFESLMREASRTA